MDGCGAAKHGTESAYDNFGCRCPDAREQNRINEKRRREGRHVKPYVDPTGSVRRLQALAALGHSGTTLAEELGMTRQRLNEIRNARLEVRRETAAKIAALYDRLSMTPGDSELTKARAEAKGWAPPLAWDDDAIDNPAAQPITAGGSPRGRLDLDDVKHLESFGVSRHEIASRMNVQLESIERAEFRAQERARAAVERARQAMNVPAQWTPAPTLGDDHAMAR
jgi:transcriptional regulator with XRE-family HTH domain